MLLDQPAGVSPSLAAYRELSQRLDRDIARADRLIARTAQRRAEAGWMIAQAGPPAGDGQPTTPDSSGTGPPKTSPGSADPKDQPASAAGEKPPSQEPSASATEQGNTAPESQAPVPSAAQPGTSAKDQPATEAASKEQPAPGAAPKDKPSSGAAKQEEEEREVARVPLAAVQAGGLLLARDQMIIEPSIFYTYSQNTRLIITGFSVLPLIILGTLESERITSSLVSPALQLRYGLFRGVQLDFRLPYTYANTSLLRVSTEHAGQVEESQHDFGLGDINFGLTYQFLYERGWLPDLMFRIGMSVPTGQSQFDIYKKIAQEGGLVSPEAFLHALNTSGVALGAGRYNIQTSVNGVKALDPGILFATVGWNYTPASTENLIAVTATPVEGGVVLHPTLISARLGPVNSLLVSAGLAISLNNQLSVNFSVSDLLSAATTADGIKIPGSSINVGQFNFGMTLAISPTTTINLLTQIGATTDAPQFSTLLSVPVFYNNAMETAYTSLKSSLTNLFRGKPAPIEQPK